jgi:hypothetical protein
VDQLVDVIARHNKDGSGGHCIVGHYKGDFAFVLMSKNANDSLGHLYVTAASLKYYSHILRFICGTLDNATEVIIHPHGQRANERENVLLKSRRNGFEPTA